MRTHYLEMGRRDTLCGLDTIAAKAPPFSFKKKDVDCRRCLYNLKLKSREKQDAIYKEYHAFMEREGSKSVPNRTTKPQSKKKLPRGTGNETLKKNQTQEKAAPNSQKVREIALEAVITKRNTEMQALRESLRVLQNRERAVKEVLGGVITQKSDDYHARLTNLYELMWGKLDYGSIVYLSGWKTGSITKKLADEIEKRRQEMAEELVLCRSERDKYTCEVKKDHKGMHRDGDVLWNDQEDAYYKAVGGLKEQNDE